MPFVVETGEGLANANSYVSVADAGLYLAARGDGSWAAASVEEKEAALIRATAAIDAAYGSSFGGKRMRLRLQSLEWPRSDAYDTRNDIIRSDEVPAEVRNATAEAALVELTTPGILFPSFDRESAIKKIKAGSVEIEFAGNASRATIYSTIYYAIRTVLLGGGGYSGRVVRG